MSDGEYYGYAGKGTADIIAELAEKQVSGRMDARGQWGSVIIAAHLKHAIRLHYRGVSRSPHRHTSLMQGKHHVDVEAVAEDKARMTDTHLHNDPMAVIEPTLNVLMEAKRRGLKVRLVGTDSHLSFGLVYCICHRVADTTCTVKSVAVPRRQVGVASGGDTEHVRLVLERCDMMKHVDALVCRDEVQYCRLGMSYFIFAHGGQLPPSGSGSRSIAQTYNVGAGTEREAGP
jgi:FMN phosphatase YigB (HAD superfamily)